MILKGDTMELLAVEDPVESRSIFEKKVTGEFTWEVKKEQEGEFVAHITKRRESDAAAEDIAVVNMFDVRPFPTAKRHDMVFDAFDELKPGEAFIFVNDHDPKPLDRKSTRLNSSH